MLLIREPGKVTAGLTDCNSNLVLGLCLTSSVPSKPNISFGQFGPMKSYIKAHFKTITVISKNCQHYQQC